MLGWAPMQSAPDLLPDGTAVPEDDLLGPERCLLFARGERSFAVPLGIIVQVLENVAIHPVPLSQPSHAGLLYHGKALHPVFDVGVLFGDPPRSGRTVLLVDAGGNAVGLLADRVLALGEEGPGGPVHRPSWDALFAA
jgi:chemotaxis signal transduction protein